MPRQSAAVRPSPTSTANSHSSSKSEPSSVLSTGSSAPAPDSRLRAVTWHSPFPASSFKEARNGLCQVTARNRSEEHTSELQSRGHLVCRLLLEKKSTQQQHRLPIRRPRSVHRLLR